MAKGDYSFANYSNIKCDNKPGQNGQCSPEIADRNDSCITDVEIFNETGKFK